MKKGFSSYTDYQIEYVKNNYQNMSVKQIALKLALGENQVFYIARKYGLSKQVHKPWTEEENQFLIQHYVDMTSEEIGKHLGRTTASINTQRDRLGLVRHETWTKDEIKYLQENHLRLSYDDIGKHLNRTEQAVRAKCFDLGLYKKEKPWDDAELEYLYNNYYQMSTSEIAEHLGRSHNGVHLKASRLGMKKYPYYCDYHYFDNIDTEEKAYWLGFLTADGWINKNDETNSGVVGIELQYGDLKHLKKFNKSIGGNYTISDRWRPCLLSNPDKKYHMCLIRIFSIVMYTSLSNIGFTNNKSFDAHIPHIQDDLMRHFIRGYFDGDGCLSVSNNRINVSFVTASNELNNDLMSLLDQLGIKYRVYNYVSEYGTQMYKCDVRYKTDMLKFLHYIYDDCNIYLDRKYKKFKKAIEKHEYHKSLAS